MHILVAPDSFTATGTATGTATTTGSANAPLVAAGIAAGVRATSGEVTVRTLPCAGGGAGTAEVIANAAAARGAEIHAVTLPTTDAMGRLTEATYFFNATEATAYIDLAAASGLTAVIDVLDPLHADTYGTGVLIADAQSRGATHIVLGLGECASTDGGTGILTALGAAAHDSRGYALPKGGAPLVTLDSFDTAQLNMKAALLDYTLLTDSAVDPAHSALVHGPHQGAAGEQLALLTGAMLQLCQVTGIDPETPAYGAGGGIPVGITWMSSLLFGNNSHVRVIPAAAYVADAYQLETELATADLIITAQHHYDPQSLPGQTVGVISELAAQKGVPVAIIAGSFAATPDCLHAQLSGQEPLPEQLRAAAGVIMEQFRTISY